MARHCVVCGFDCDVLSSHINTAGERQLTIPIGFGASRWYQRELAFLFMSFFLLFRLFGLLFRLFGILFGVLFGFTVYLPIFRSTIHQCLNALIIFIFDDSDMDLIWVSSIFMNGSLQILPLFDTGIGQQNKVAWLEVFTGITTMRIPQGHLNDQLTPGAWPVFRTLSDVPVRITRRAIAIIFFSRFLVGGKLRILCVIRYVEQAFFTVKCVDFDNLPKQLIQLTRNCVLDEGEGEASTFRDRMGGLNMSSLAGGR